MACIGAVIAICHLTLQYAMALPSAMPFAVTGLLLIFYSLCVYLIYQHNNLLKSKLYEIEGTSRHLEEKLAMLKNKDSNLRERNSQLERSLNEIVTIYEYVRKLGSTMDFGEAVAILEEALCSLIQFNGGKLIVLKEQAVSKVYEIFADKEKNKTGETVSLKQYEENIVARITKNPQSFVYEKGKLTPFGNMPGDVETLLALPLVVEKQLVAVIMLKNLQLTNMERLHFITLQFAMEVKKTQLYEKVKELSKIDSLTQLYLRRHFMSLLNNELDRGYRQNQPLSFLMLDIDYFKRYNDEYGHLAGDLILKKVASILNDKSREIDLLCRYGGDEFALVLPRTALQDARVVAERLRRAISEHLFHITNEQVQVTVSIGIAACDPKDMRLDGICEKVIDLADKALYQAKSLGRNKVVVVA